MKKQFLLTIVILFSYQLYAQNSMSLSLNEAIAYALENSYASINAKRDISLSEQKNKETVAFGLPQLDALVDYNYWIPNNEDLIKVQESF